MKALKSYTLTIIFLAGSFVVLTAVGPCQDQGSKYSYAGVSASAFGLAEETEFERLLQIYVDKDHLVNYQKWLQSPQDFQVLKNVIEAMGKADETAMTYDQKKAFYINAYNALTLDLILSNYSKTYGGNYLPNGRSIRNINNLDTAVWDEFKWLVAGKQKSLNDIENKILRPMGDARIHFAIVCASMGCPPIYGRAFTASKLNTDLDNLALAFVNSGRSTVIDKDKRIISTSQILKWFAQDFVKSFGSVQDFFERYVRVIPAQDVSLYKLEFSDYDWSLNESQGGGSGTENEIPTSVPTTSPSPSPSASPTPGSGTEKELPSPSPSPSASASPSPSPSPTPGSGTERDMGDVS